MKTVLRKGSLSGGSVSSVSGGLRAARPGVASKPPPPPANPYKLKPTKQQSSNSTVWIVVGAVGIVIIGIILIAASGSKPEPVRAVAPAPQPVVQQSSGEAGKPDPRLGGKTWAEASKEAERNSKMMQARKSAMKSYPKR